MAARPARRRRTARISLLALGCVGCHAERRLAPPLDWLVGRRITARERRDDGRRRELYPVLDPRARADVVAGYGPTMPSYAGQITSADVTALVGALGATAELGTRPTFLFDDRIGLL